jgi:RNA polymerase sigma factor (sigma-70 family)
MAETQGGALLRQLRKLVGAQTASRLTDHHLLEQFLTRRDESAFSALVQRHGPGVLSLCRGLLHHLQDAEDVFQATFLVLARKAGSIRKRESLASWLYGVARRLASKARARAARRGRQELPATAEAEAPAGDDMTWRELRQILHEELSRLPEKYRAPLLLCYWEGRTQEEAAAQLGWSKGMFKARVQRGRELLRGRLTRRGVTLSAGLATALLCGRAGTAAEALALVNSTTRAALAFAAGKPAAAGGLSAAAALAEGVVRAMFLTKVKTAAVVLLTLGLLGAGAGVVGLQTLSAGQAGPRGKAAAPPANKQENDPARLRERIKELERELEKARFDNALLRAKLATLQDAVQRAQREAQAARLEQAEARKEVINTLKQLALAMHNYHDAHGHLPPAAIYSKDGKPLLSWRVALLPFLGENELAREFKMDEPWDSPHNKKLLAKMPQLFAPVAGKAKANATFYRVFTGKGTVFDGKKGIRLQDITDGTSNTLLIVQAGDAVPWTKPDELPYDPARALPKFGQQFKGGFYIALCDGSVRFVQTPIDEKAFRALITPNGGD